MSRRGTYHRRPLPPRLVPQQGRAADALPPGSLIYKEQRRAGCPACLGATFCYSTNIIQAANELSESTIKRETTPAAHIALPLASLLTQAIFQVVVLLPSSFPLKVAFHLNQALGVGIQTKTKGGEGRGKFSRTVACAKSCTPACVYASST